MILDKTGLVKIALNQRNGLKINYEVVINTSILNSATQNEQAGAVSFEIKNFGQAAVVTQSETMRGVENDEDSGVQETLTFNDVTQIDGLAVKKGGGLDKTYNFGVGNILCVEPMWKRPFKSSPTTIWVFQDGLYGLKAKSYNVPYTVSQVWVYITTGVHP